MKYGKLDQKNQNNFVQEIQIEINKGVQDKQHLGIVPA